MWILILLWILCGSIDSILFLKYAKSNSNKISLLDIITATILLLSGLYTLILSLLYGSSWLLDKLDNIIIYRKKD